MEERISTTEQGMQRRTERLLGTDNLARIRSARVIVFGVGGVGSWCAEGLVRSGIRHITLVDSDCVCATNCNRQLMATSKTIGQVKVDALKQHLLDINPEADITALQQVYHAENADTFELEKYDFVVDAIDSLKDKADLILRASALPKPITFISSMGAALRRDPFLVRKAEFWEVKGDPLARALRKKFKNRDQFPKRKFQCVYSEEPPMENLGEDNPCGLDTCICAQTRLISEEPNPQTEPSSTQSTKAQINGSLCHITATFGMAIAGMIINKIIDSANETSAH